MKIPSDHQNPYIDPQKAPELFQTIDNLCAYAEKTFNFLGYWPKVLIGSYLRCRLGVIQIAFAFIAGFYQLIFSTENRLENSKRYFTSYVINGLGNMGRSYIEPTRGIFLLLFAYDHIPTGLFNIKPEKTNKFPYRRLNFSFPPKGFRIILPTEQFHGVCITPDRVSILIWKTLILTIKIPRFFTESS